MLVVATLFINTACSSDKDKQSGGQDANLPSQGDPSVNVNALHPTEGDILITEVLASNASTNKDCFDQYSDWIEIYNSNDFEMDLSGFGVSDSIAQPRGCSILRRRYAARASTVQM